jgi:hypothetical protein
MLVIRVMIGQRARRGTAILASLLLMQLTLTGSGRACPMHASQNTQPDVAAGMHAMSHGIAEPHHQAMHLATLDDAEALGHCDFSCAPAACPSTVTCGGTTAAPAESGLSSLAFESNRAVAPTTQPLRSLTTAPEPPPPKP